MNNAFLISPKVSSFKLIATLEHLIYYASELLSLLLTTKYDVLEILFGCLVCIASQTIVLVPLGPRT